MSQASPAAPLSRPNAPEIHIDTSAITADNNKGPPDKTPPTSEATTADEGLAAPIMNSSSDVLQPNPGEENMFNVENNPFAFSPGQLSKLINPKSLGAFCALGGLSGLEKGLRTDVSAGLNADETCFADSVSFEAATSLLPPGDPSGCSTMQTSQNCQGQTEETFADRIRVFGENRLPKRKSKSFLELAWIALQDKVLILLSVAAAISLALGLYQTFGQDHEGASVEWIEGVAIIVTVCIVVMVGALNDWQKELKFKKLNRKKDERMVKVIRSGKSLTISVFDVLVGDLLIIEQGDMLPADGIYIDGHHVSCDESSATGESDLVKKTPANAVMCAIQEESNKAEKLDPFILSGAKILDGFGTCLVTAVGPNSSHGRTITALQNDVEMTPLQIKLNKLAGYIAKLGGSAALLLFAVLLIEFLARLPGNTGTSEEKAQNFLRILITSITVIVVAVPEGLPLAVTLALAFATKKMADENNLVRHLQSCETMGNATVICSDKTGTLTENVMTVVAGTLGPGKLAFRLQEAPAPGAGADVNTPNTTTGPAPAPTVPMTEVSSKVHPEVRELIKLSVIVNTTAFEGEDRGKMGFVGTKTETALLEWVRNHFALGPLAVERSTHPLDQLFPFSSERKCMGAVTRLPGGKYRLLVKGAPEVVLEHSGTVVSDPEAGLTSTQLQQSHKEHIKHSISHYASLSLRTLAFAYRDFEQWPPVGISLDSGSSSSDMFLDVLRDMTWIGLVAIQDPLREGVNQAVDDCGHAHISVKMVTGDNVETARAIATESGILRDNSIVMEGSEFRRLGEKERETIVRDLSVLARSSPQDKEILVKALRSLGEIVAVTGDGTNDAPALKAADVGFSMGITGTEVAKEASDIILMDDNFASIVKAMGWGRAINDAVKKFLQFQLTVNITAVILTFVSAVASDDETSVINAVQLLWVNLIMDSFAALALATDPPNAGMLRRKPEPKTASLINIPMWKMIIGQSIYQLIVCFVLHFGGPHFLDYPEDERRTLVFNVFVFMQIFKLINSRRIDNELNIFEGLHRNKLFFLMFLIMAGGQVLIIFVGGAAFVVTRLNGEQWGISLVLGFISIPVGILIRLVPDSWWISAVRVIIPKFIRTWWASRKKSDENAEEPQNMGDVYLVIRDDLAFLKKVKGGRIRLLPDAAITKARELRSQKKSDSPPRSPRRKGSVAPIRSAIGMPGIMAASVGGLSPVTRSSSKSSSQ